MASRISIRYESVWVRLIACLITANAVWYALGARAMVMMEELMYELLLASRFRALPEAPSSVETSLVFVLCLAPAFLRLDRPLILLACGLLIALCYGLALAAGLLLQIGILPVTGPMLGLLSSTAVLGSMAWSEERRRRYELERMERAKQQFTDMLVHDLKGRISATVMSIKMLQKQRPQPSEKEQQLLDTVSSSTNRMLLQVNALLDIRKIQEGEMKLHRESVPLEPLVAAALEEYQPAAGLVGVDLQNRLDAENARPVSIDRDMFSRIVSNLLWNALRHAPRGSAVEVSCEHSGPSTVNLHVANRGEAIPADEQSRLFDAFVSGSRDRAVHRGGTGLGLTFCKLAAEAHGGHIHIESPWQPFDDGVKVTVALPIA